MNACAGCGGGIDASFRFCPWCGAPQRLKIVQFFRGHRDIERPGRALRVSRYFGSAPSENHLRFSIWSDEGRAEAAVSLDPAEGARLGRFLAATASAPGVSRIRRLLRV